MTLEAFVTIYGYPALFTGVVLEGETVVVIAGFLAHQGYLRLPLVILTVFLAAFAADQFSFQVGKRKGVSLVEKRPRLRSRIESVRRFLARYHIVAILSYRFVFGMRIITPIIIGASGFGTFRFILLNICSTLLWAGTIATAGYFFGHSLHEFVAGARHYERATVLIIAGAGALLWLYRYRRKKSRH